MPGKPSYFSPKKKPETNVLSRFPALLAHGKNNLFFAFPRFPRFLWVFSLPFPALQGFLENCCSPQWPARAIYLPFSHFEGNPLG